MFNEWLAAIVPLLGYQFSFCLVAVLIKHAHLKAKKKRNIRNREVMGLAVATLCGYLYFIGNNLWSVYTPEFNPIYRWLIDNTVQSPWFRPLVIAQDIIQKILLAIPVAWLLLNIRPSQVISYLLLFMLPSFAHAYLPLFLNAEFYQDWQMFLAGIIFQLTVFPIVYVCLYKFKTYRDASLIIEK